MPVALDLGFRSRLRHDREAALVHAVTVLPPVERPRLWGPIGAGLVLHAVLAAVVLWKSSSAAPTLDRARASEPRPTPVEMVYLTPPPARVKTPAPRVAPKAVPAPPPQVQRDTRPPSRVTRSPDSEPGAGAQPSRTTRLASETRVERESKSERTPEAASETELETEARHLFGPRSAPTADGGPAIRELAALGPAGNAASPSDCRPTPHPPRSEGEPPRMGRITGRILQRNSDRPLPNAHLQIIGTPFVAFTDAGGWYTFRFDEDLVAECRTQVVRVSAPGYRTQWLSVVVAPNAQNSDVRLDHGS